MLTFSFSFFLSFLNARGEGFEAFFTSEGFLVLAVHTKKEFLTTTVTSAPFNDQDWVSINILIVSRDVLTTTTIVCLKEKFHFNVFNFVWLITLDLDLNL